MALGSITSVKTLFRSDPAASGQDITGKNVQQKQFVVAQVVAVNGTNNIPFSPKSLGLTSIDIALFAVTVYNAAAVTDQQASFDPANNLIILADHTGALSNTNGVTLLVMALGETAQATELL